MKTLNCRRNCTCAKCAVGIGPQKATSLTSAILAFCSLMKHNPKVGMCFKRQYFRTNG